MSGVTRVTSFGETHAPSWVDRFGQWLSSRQLLSRAGDLRGKRIADLGCGYYATILRAQWPSAKEITLIDLHLDRAIKNLANVRAIERALPGALDEIAEGTLDVVAANSILEHLVEPERCLKGIHRVLSEDGLLLINVPSWRGKWFLETAAFRLGWSPAEEMDDHKRYYDPRDLWPMLVAAGFRPSRIDCFSHKFGLNTFAVARK